MGIMVIAAYRPYPGKERDLLELIKEHLPILRSQDLVTDRPSIVMRAADGTILKVFEWKSKEPIAAAHTNPVVLAMWERFGKACDYTPLASIQEATGLFAEFEPVNLS
jgi:hypothetical protein